MNFSMLDQYMESLPQRGVPAAELAVTKDGELVYRKTVGYSDSEATKPTTENDLYWIFSATKVITCVAAMRLVESGVIRLDDPVSKYIPAFAEVKVIQKDKSVAPAQNVMTVEHLFTMTGGLTYDLKTPNIKAVTSVGGSTFDIVSAMAKDPLMFEPGTRYRYSLCHDVLAAVVEVASGMRFSEYLRKYIFDPLEIKDMGFFPNDAQLARFSDMYVYRTGEVRAEKVALENAYTLSENYESGGAGLFSSVNEYIKIVTVLACGGTTKDGYKLLSPESIKMMGENRLCKAAHNDFVTTRLYGYGWGLCGRAHIDPFMSMSPSPSGEFGWDGAAGAFALVDPTNRVAAYFGMQVKGCQYIYHIGHPLIRKLIYDGING